VKARTRQNERGGGRREKGKSEEDSSISTDVQMISVNGKKEGKRHHVDRGGCEATLAGEAQPGDRKGAKGEERQQP
jgi:hypothetical protein